MEYTENIEQARNYAKQAIEKMREIGVPANPNNFTIWFHYFSGTYPDLKRTLDILLGNQQEFTETRNSEIFQKFFTLDQESATLHDATNRMESELARVMSTLDGADEDLTSLDQSLRTFSENLSKAEDKTQIQTLTDSLQTQVQQVLVHHSKLEDQLKESIREIEDLKDDLERMRREAMTDGLTGIANRKLFDLELRKASMHAMANGEDLALIMMDVDHFDRFNEHYGHQVGDQVLKLVAVTIGECIKGQDTAARYGGDEFSVILPRTNLDNAVRLAEHICKRVSSKNVVNRSTGERLGKITMSAGVALFEYGEPISQFLVRADRTLQESMRNGYNQVTAQDVLERQIGE